MARGVFALAWLLLVTGCVGAPADDAPIASKATAISFSGYDLTPSTSVRLEVALSRSGPFVQFASTTTSAQAITLQDGTKLYSWKVSAAVPSWKSICDGSETFVRARSQGGYFLISYEGAAGATPSGVSCVVQKLSDGEPTIASMLSCASPESPVMRLTTAAGGLPTVHRGDVVVNTQAEAEAYACIEQLNGSLTIGGGSNELSIALPHLHTISGDLNLTWLRDPLVSPFLPVVRNINLSALQSVGGNLVGTYQGIAADYISFDMRLEALTSVGGDIALELVNTSNGDLQGFDSLVTHAGDLSVLGGSGDAAWYSLFPNLDSVAGDVHVRTGHSTYGIMRKLTSVSGDLWVQGSLLHTEGVTGSFPLLQAVAGDLTFTGLEVTGGGTVMPALGDVAGQLTIADGGVSLTTLSLGAASGLDLHALALTNNPSLTSWDNLHWHVLGSGTITITHNGGLPPCAAENFVATQQGAGWTGSAMLAGNTVCP